MMHDVVFRGNKTIIKHSDSVRVQCEAADCGALLEIEVPTRQYQPSLIVRCGNCNRLLSVSLSQGTRSSQSGEPVLLKGTYGNDLGPTAVPMPQTIRTETTKQSPLTKVHLARPPPLSRAQGMVHVGQEDLMRSSAVQIYHSGFGIATSQQGTAGGIAASNQMMNEYYMMRRNGDGLKSESGMTKKGAGGKIKKDRPVRHASPYNRFMSQEVKRIKAENPEVDHRKAFKMAASNWARSPTACQKAATEFNHTTNGVELESPGSITGSNDTNVFHQRGASDSSSCVKDASLMHDGINSERSGRGLEELL